MAKGNNYTAFCICFNGLISLFAIIYYIVTDYEKLSVGDIAALVLLGVATLVFCVLLPLGALLCVICAKWDSGICCVRKTDHQSSMDRPPIPTTYELVNEGQSVTNTDSSSCGLPPRTLFSDSDSPPSYTAVMANEALYPTVVNNRAPWINDTDNDNDTDNNNDTDNDNDNNDTSNNNDNGSNNDTDNDNDDKDDDNISDVLPSYDMIVED